MYIDNKTFAVPTHKGAIARLRMGKVRGHLRAPAEGLKQGFTKPSGLKHKSNPGANVKICGGIIGGQVKLWHELPQRWNGEIAAGLYRGPLRDALRAHRGVKRRYTLLEDNDPTGYKSRKAQAAKEEVGVYPVRFPKYSPDLNPLDFYVWSEIERRALSLKGSGFVSAKAYKKRLQRIAKALPRAAIERALASIPRRAKAIVDAKGGYVPFD